jgi:hypothetical protein
MFEVRDGARTLQFEGELLGASSSRRRNSIRWIEFKLYRTESGTYILSRIGVSLIYHSATCFLVKKYELADAPVTTLNTHAIGCDTCLPTRQAPLVYPEKYRYWAQVSEEPEAVLNSLYKFDDLGARYLTWVARQVLEEAAKNDDRIDSIYRFEQIP